MDTLNKENATLQTLADASTSFVQKQSAEFGGALPVSGLGSDASFLHSNPWQQPLSVANQLSQSSELQPSHAQQQHQQYSNLTPADRSVSAVSQHSQQMSTQHVQDMSVYTGLNSSQQATHYTQPISFGPLVPLGSATQGRNAASWHVTK